MSRQRKRVGRALILFLMGTSLASADDARPPLEPFQMVRSLQFIQDRIADGDHAILPMQTKLLEIIDNRLRKAETNTLQDRHNFHAVLIYAMSGGNPATIASVASRVDIPEEDRKLAAGILSYLLGDVAQARAAMEAIDPNSHPANVAAFLWLVKGSVAAGEDSQAGLAMLDKARLVSPGTLVEEAALRRIVTFAAASHNVARFAAASEQYARRFLRSPYAAEFAASLVTGIVALRPHGLQVDQIGHATAWMSREQARTIYLRLARRSAIDGDTPLLDYASRMAEELAGEGPDPSDTRGELYSTLSSVTTETVDEVLQKLTNLDPARLSASDRALLDAAKLIATEVIAPVSYTPPPSPIPGSQVDADDEEVHVTEQDPMPTWQAEPTTDPLVTSARSKLEAIDKMLEENGK